jgi:putative ABC transport system permease protein
VPGANLLTGVSVASRLALILTVFPASQLGSLVPIARRNLLADKVKLLVALGGVTLAIVLILVVQSLYYGVRRESDTFIYDLPGDIWITQQGTDSLVFSNSHLPEWADDAIRSVDGVERVYGLYGRLMTFQTNNGEVRTFVMALGPLGDPVTTDVTRYIPQAGTIIVDRTFARQAGLSHGDTLTFAEHRFTVAEVRHVGNVLVTQFAFIEPGDFQQVLGVEGTVNYFLVSLSEGADRAAVMQKLDGMIEGSSVFTTEEFAGRASEKGTGDFLPIIRVIMFMSFIVGFAVLTLTIYSATIERAREYAIMKVMGASPLQLYRIVLSQSALISTLGFGLGVGLAFVFNHFAGDIVPQFITYIRWRDIAFVLAVAAAMSFAASYLPLNRVARADPASVFRA